MEVSLPRRAAAQEDALQRPSASPFTFPRAVPYLSAEDLAITPLKKLHPRQKYSPLTKSPREPFTFSPCPGAHCRTHSRQSKTLRSVRHARARAPHSGPVSVCTERQLKSAIPIPSAKICARVHRYTHRDLGQTRSKLPHGTNFRRQKKVMGPAPRPPSLLSKPEPPGSFARPR